MNTMIGTADPVLGKVGANVYDGPAFGPYSEGLLHNLRFPGVRLKSLICPATVTGRDVGPRDHAGGDRSSLCFPGSFPDRSAVILRDRSDHGSREPLRGGTSGDLSEVHGHHPTASTLDTRQNLVLDAQGAAQAVEVGDQHHIHFPSFNSPHSGAQALSALKRSAARYVDLLVNFRELPAFALAMLRDPISLLSGRERIFSALRLAYDPYRSHRGVAYCSRNPGYPRRGVRNVTR